MIKFIYATVHPKMIYRFYKARQMISVYNLFYGQMVCFVIIALLTARTTERGES